MIITFNGNKTISIKRNYKQLSENLTKEGHPLLFFLNWQLQITLITYLGCRGQEQKVNYISGGIHYL